MAMYAAKSFNSFSVSLIADGFNAMYQILALILFVCLTWMASKMLDVLADQLTTDRMTLSGAISQRLQKWTHDYGLINDYIKEINDFFGTILFLSFGNQILNIILNLSLLKRQEEINFFVVRQIALVFRDSLFISITILVSHRVHRNVNNNQHSQK